MHTNTDQSGVIDATTNNQGFDQMAQGLKQAMQDFDVQKAPDYFAMFGSAVRPVTNFVRRHPVQSAIGVIAIGLLASRFITTDMPRSRDGRQY